jgi:hypothetical protein
VASTVNLVGLLQESENKDNFDDNLKSIYTVYKIAEGHSIDRENTCSCGLAYPEHAVLRRKILKLF